MDPGYFSIERAGPNTFKIEVPSDENEIWPIYAIQVVKKSLNAVAPKDKINKKDVKLTRQFNQEVSVKEQAANLAAPATRNKSERAKKVNYRELAGLKN